MNTTPSIQKIAHEFLAELLPLLAGRIRNDVEVITLANTRRVHIDVERPVDVRGCAESMAGKLPPSIGEVLDVSFKELGSCFDAARSKHEGVTVCAMRLYDAKRDKSFTRFELVYV